MGEMELFEKFCEFWDRKADGFFYIAGGLF